MKFMVYVLLVAVFGLSCIVGYQFEAIAKSRADARARGLETWHAVICKIEQATIASPQLTLAKKRLVIKFYDDLLLNISAQPCGLVVK